MRTLIAGIGYSNLSDLSLGPIIAARLQQESWPAHVEVDDLSYGPIAVVHRFAETQPAYRRLVLVGAADRGETAGRVRWYRWDGRLPRPEEIQARVAEAVTGVIDLDNLLIVAGQFGALPEEVFVVEVQPARTDCGMMLGPEIAALLPELCRLVRCIALMGSDGSEGRCAWPTWSDMPPASPN